MSLTRRKYLALLSTSTLATSRKSLTDEWRRIASATDGIVGAAALHLKSGRCLSLNGQERFPLASVCKLPIAIRLLMMVDDGHLQLERNVEVLPRDVWPCWDGDLASLWPGERRFKLLELIELMVAQSDNTAVQTLFRVGGEASAMAASFTRWQVTGIRVDRYEGECALQAHGVMNYPPVDQWTPGIVTRLIAKIPLQTQYLGMQKFLNDPRDTGTPNGTVNLLGRLFQGELLSAQSTAQLKTILEKTATGKERLKGLLPPGTIVAHKTGTMGTIKGLNGGTNDVGVIMLPGDAGELAIAVYIKGSTRDQRTRNRIIAQIARAAYVAFQSLGRIKSRPASEQDRSKSAPK